MRRQLSSTRKAAKPAARKDKASALRARAIGLAAVAAALEVSLDDLAPEFAALVENGAASIAPRAAQLAA
jgi:hypothetical protein